MENRDKDTGAEKRQDGISKPSDGTGSQVGRTPQGGGQNNGSSGNEHSGGRDSSQEGGRND